MKQEQGDVISQSPCLFCTSSCDNPDKPPSDHDCYPEIGNQEIKKEPSKRSAFATELSPEDAILDGHLKAIFIIRHVLGLSAKTASQYLRQNEGETRPDLWFSVCSACERSVEQCFLIRRNILQLERKLEKVRVGLTDLICSTQSKQELSNQRINGMTYEVRQNFLGDNPSRNYPVEIKGNSSITPVRRNSEKSEKECEGEQNSTQCDFPSPVQHEVFETHWMPSDNGCDVEDQDGGVKTEGCKKPKPDEVKNLLSGESGNEVPKTIRHILYNVSSGRSVKLKHTKTEVRKSSHAGLNGTTKRNRKFHCENCSAIYPTRKLLQLHVRLHENHSGLTCCSCGWLCEHEEDIQNHLKKFHKPPLIKRRYRLRRVRKTARGYVTIKSKLLGKMKNTDELPYYCDHCHMIFTRSGLLIKHVRDFHKAQNMSICQLCKSKYASKQLLEIHSVESHNTVVKKDYANEYTAPTKCKYCKDMFLSKLKMDYHIAEVHKDCLLACQTCGFKARLYSRLVMHMKSHTKEKLVVCEFCSKAYKNIHSLRAHKLKTHSTSLGLEEILCNQCGNNFSSTYALQKHVKYVHEKKKDACCDICGKAFGTKSDVRKHRLLHTAPRELQYQQGPFTCEYCQAQFNVRQGLYYHLKRLHSDKYLCRCLKCGKGYTAENAFNYHQRTCKVAIQIQLAHNAK